MIHEDKVHSIKDIDSLLKFLREELNWQLPESDISDITFDWTGTELNLSEDIHHKLKDGIVRQFQPFRTDQPWGIFVVDFDTDKFLVTPIRDMLRCLVSKKRGQSPDHPSWNLPNLLFICLYGDDGFTFAYFKGDKPFGSLLATFRWHPGDPIRTVCEFNLPALAYENKWSPDVWTQAWQTAFDVEKVNKDFYSKIADFFYRLTGKNGRLRELVLPSQAGAGNSKDYEEFAVRLIGRIVFCWFLKHKYSRSTLKKPLIPPEVLSLNAVDENADYYHRFLEPLFFEVMNKEIPQRKPLALPKVNDIPYLNGGLFEQHPKDFYNNHPVYTLKVPDGWFKDLFKVLEQYNFTIDENSGIDVDVSVDPEMLGRIFEKLLAEVTPETGETARKASGSYYTPRVIVDYMVEQSLKQYLLTNTKIQEEKITCLIAYGEAVDDFTQAEKLAVIKALTDIKIIDPACGSGAFPMGVLHRMLLAMEKVDPKLEIWRKQYLEALDPVARQVIEKNIRKENWAYIRKLIIIRDAIYGVDIQPIAVEITKLRCFLTLVVDEMVDDNEPNRGIESLPNLEFKFVAANTLIGLPAKIDDFGSYETKDLTDKLRKIRKEYLTTSGKLKEQLKLDFLEVQGELRAKIDWALPTSQSQKLAVWDPFSYESNGWFDPEWMFGVTDGFDVVIANPPYLGISEISWEQRRLYETLFKTAKGRFDLYVLFIEKAMLIKKPNGSFIYIVPGKFLNNKQFVIARKNICDKYGVTVIKIDDKVFEAQVDSAIVGNYFVENPLHCQYRAYRMSSQKIELISEADIETILFDDEVIFRVEINTNIDLLISKIEKDTIRTKQIAEVKDGIVAGVIKDILFLDKKLDNDSKKLYFGKHISRYCLDNTSAWVNYKPDQMMKNEIKRQGDKRPGLWMRNENIFKREKIIYRKVAKHLIATYDKGGLFYEQTIHSVHITDQKIKTKYVLSLFNSSLLKFYYQKTNSQGGDIFPQVRISSVENLPIKIADNSAQKIIEAIVDCILLLKTENKESSFFESLINAMVYELYFPEEIKATNAEVLKHLTKLPELKDDWSNERKMQTIEKVCKELSDPAHPVSIAMDKMKTVPEVRIIEGLDK